VRHRFPVEIYTDEKKAGKVSNETKNMSEEIPWQDIIDMRNHLIHAYFDVDLDIVWDTIPPGRATL
jgi:uncharacterized protein with HEPN domain